MANQTRDNDKDFPLLAYLDDLVESLRKLVDDALAGRDKHAVHDARVATRRLKAATDLLEPFLSGKCRKPFDKITKSLRKRLGPLRDTDVMLEHLKELGESRQPRATHWLKAHLEQARADSLDSASKTDPARVLAKLGSWWGLRTEIIAAQEKITCRIAESVHLQLDAFTEQSAALVAGENNDPHQLRIAGKSLRYTLEMARAHGSALPAAVLSLFKRMQDALGLWHDYVVLTERMLCETLACDLALHEPETFGQVLAFAQLTRKRAQSHLDRMARLWKEKGDELAQSIRAAFPLSSAVPPEAPAEAPNPPEPRAISA